MMWLKVRKLLADFFNTYYNFTNFSEKSWNFPKGIMERVLRSVYDITDDFSTEPIKDQEDQESDGKVNVAV